MSERDPRGNPGPDERVKLAVFGSYVSWLLLLTNLRVLAAVMGAMAVMLLLTSPAPGTLFRRWVNGAPAAVLVVVLFWVFAPSETKTWFAVLGKQFGPEGITKGIFFGARFLAFLLGGFYLYGSSSPQDLARGVLWFLAPLRVLKVPVYLLYYVIWFAMRSIPLLAEEAQIISLAQRARGARLPTAAGRLSPRRWWSKEVLALVIPVFAAAARRSDRFALALEARGFDPALHYRFCRPGRLTTSDVWWLAGLAAAWGLFIYGNWGRL